MATVQITWEDVVALAPELASVSLAGQSQLIDQVKMEINVSAWGSQQKANAAAIWLARHVATVYGKGGTGVVTSVSAGPVSKSFASPTGKLSLETTRYGREYCRLIQLWMPRFAVT